MMMMMTGTVTYVCLALYDDLKSATRFKLQDCNHDPHAHWRNFGGGFTPPKFRRPYSMMMSGTVTYVSLVLYDDLKSATFQVTRL